ncbi:hypothetical protein H1C71_001677 [Ictidomys tridecemlineatus]|nr:hypothetical protein H1C71_001677 [Ictidomys tridecemlineatus]
MTSVLWLAWYLLLGLGKRVPQGRATAGSSAQTAHIVHREQLRPEELCACLIRECGLSPKEPSEHSAGSSFSQAGRACVFSDFLLQIQPLWFPGWSAIGDFLKP